VTAPRIISAYEAEALLRHGTDAELAAAASDLAAYVVALHAEVEQVAAAERARIAAWLRRKAMAGLAAGLPDTPTLLGLLAYADAIQADNTQE
jgi:hypothetical protein